MAKKKKAKTKKTARKVLKKQAAKKSAKKKAPKKAAKKSPKKAMKKSPSKATKSKPKGKKTPLMKPTPSVTVALSKGPRIGTEVPDFELPSTIGAPFKLSEFRGRKIILYFYPKDATSGCTLEGHEFSKLLGDFHAHNADVLGVSRDTLKSHDAFKASENFKVDLLSDEQEQVCKIFDVIKEKNMYGKKTVGIERSTFVIDPEGKVAAEWRKVTALGHAQEVLEKIKGI